MLLRQLSLPALLLLTACGGGASDPMDDAPKTPKEIEDEFIEEQNSEPEEQVIPEVDVVYALNNRKIIQTRRVVEGTEPAVGIPFADRVSTLETVDFDVTYKADGTIVVALGDDERVLTLDSDGIFRGAGGAFIDRRYDNAQDVETVAFNFSDAEFKREGFLVVGLDSSLADVNAQTGSAEYNGLMEIRINTGGPLEGNAEFGSGNGESLSGFGAGSLNVDFDNDTVAGGFNVTDRTQQMREDPADGNRFPRIRVNLEESSIADGVFGGDVNVVFRDGEAFGNPDVTFTDGTYDGSFFGDAAISAGGQVSGLIQNGDDTYAVQGAFATNRPPE